MIDPCGTSDITVGMLTAAIFGSVGMLFMLFGIFVGPMLWHGMRGLFGPRDLPTCQQNQIGKYADIPESDEAYYERCLRTASQVGTKWPPPDGPPPRR